MTWSLAQRELLVTLAVPGPADAEVVFLHLLETHSPETSCHPCSFPPVVSAKQPQAPMICSMQSPHWGPRGDRPPSRGASRAVSGILGAEVATLRAPAAAGCCPPPEDADAGPMPAASPVPSHLTEADAKAGVPALPRPGLPL